MRPFPEIDDGRWEATTDGGHSPVWSPNGRELFYYSGGTMWAVPCAVAYVVAFVVLLVGNVLSNFY